MFPEFALADGVVQATRLAVGAQEGADLVGAIYDAVAFLNGGQVGELADAEFRAHCLLLRDIVGTPFRSPPLAPSLLAWHGATVKLAQAIYEERSLPSGHLDPARLAVLADMLEESSCSDAELLGHLRSAGPHVRGCWVVDKLLGRD
jgi:hypothetical protein